MDNITEVTANPPIDPAIAQASQRAAHNDPDALARLFAAEIERAQAAQTAQAANGTADANAPIPAMSGGKTEDELLRIDDPNIVLTQAAVQPAYPAPSPQTPPSQSPATPPTAANDNALRNGSPSGQGQTPRTQGAPNTVRIPLWMRGANPATQALQMLKDNRDSEADTKFRSTLDRFGLEQNSQGANASRVYNESSWQLPWAYQGVDKDDKKDGNNTAVSQATMWNEYANPGMWNAAGHGHKLAKEHLDRVVEGAVKDHEHRNDPNYKPQYRSEPYTDQHGNTLFHVKNKEEAHLVAGMRKEHKSSAEIQHALEELRGRKTDNGKQTQPPQASKDAPTQAPTQPEKPETSPTEHNEHGHVTHSAEEASLVRSMVAQGKSPQEIDAALKSSRTNMAGERSAVTSEVDPLSPVLEHDKDGNEIYYRTMSEKHFKILETKGKLVGTGETSTSPIEAYAQRYDGVLVKITVKKGTSAKLQEIGVAADGPAAAKFPQMHTNVDNWNEEHARFKVEVKGNPYYNSGHGVMNTQLGNGSALKIFQDNLIRFEVVRKGKGSKKVQD